MKFILAILAFLVGSDAALAQTSPSQPVVPMGYCQLTSIDSAVALSSCSGGIPAGARLAYLVPEAQAIRYRDDGTNPTTAVGFPVAVGTAIFYTGTLSKVIVISQTSGAKLNVLFYRSP